MISEKVALVDLDGTLIKGQSQFHLLKYYFKQGRVSLADYLRITIWFLQYKFFSKTVDKGFVEKIYTKLVKGVSAKEAEQIISHCFDERMKSDVNHELLARLRLLQEKGYRLILVSASASPVVSKFAQEFGFDDWLATELEVVDSHYTGKIIGEINEKEEKPRRLKSMFKQSEFSGYAFGDSLSDLPMLELVQNPVAVNPKHLLRRLAKNRDWEIL